MTGNDAVGLMIDALNACGIDYMLVGSYSSNYYGVARATKDADIVLQLRDGQMSLLAKKLPEEFELDPQVGFETVTGTTRTLIQVPEIPFTIELFDLGSDEHDRVRFENRVRVNDGGREVCLPKAEDVIVMKLRWCRGGNRSKDYQDCLDVAAVQGDALDWEYMRGWCGKHGTLELLEEVRELTRGI